MNFHAGPGATPTTTLPAIAAVLLRCKYLNLFTITSCTFYTCLFSRTIPILITKVNKNMLQIDIININILMLY